MKAQLEISAELKERAVKKFNEVVKIAAKLYPKLLDSYKISGC